MIFSAPYSLYAFNTRRVKRHLTIEVSGEIILYFDASTRLRLFAQVYDSQFLPDDCAESSSIIAACCTFHSESFCFMSPIINPESAGKERTQFTKAIVLAVRELARQKDVTDEAKDLAAFIALALQSISEGIDVSVAAWEKRGYWVKADRFRMEWIWTGQVADKMKSAILAEDWGTVALLSAQIAQKFSKIIVSENHRLGKPWVGAYSQLNGKQ
jgi:hypothetical protein